MTQAQGLTTRTSEFAEFEAKLYPLLREKAGVNIEKGFYACVEDVAQIFAKDPALLKKFLTQLNTGREAPFGKMEYLLRKLLDNIFRHSENHWESGGKFLKDRPELRSEQLIYVPTKYSQMQAMINYTRPGENDVFYDLGSGYGKVVLYTALMTDARCVGIEVLKERVSLPTRVAKDMKLKNAEFIEANVLDADLSAGNIFFMFNPFSSTTLKKVLENLRQVAEGKKITIAHWGGRREFLEAQDWLKFKKLMRAPHTIEFFESV